MKKCFFLCFKPRNNLKKNLWNFGGLQKFLHEFGQICPQTIFFFENSKFQFSNRRHFRYNLYFFMGLKYVWKVSRVFSYLQKFLPKPPTNQNNPTQKLEKIEKNDLFSDLIYGRNFCTMTEISTILKILNIFVFPKPVSWNSTHKPNTYIKLKKNRKMSFWAKFLSFLNLTQNFKNPYCCI